MEKIIEPKSYKKMVENYTHPVHVYGKKINLKEGVGAGYDLTFLGIKLTNVKVEEPQKDRDGVYTARFTADIVPGEYDFCADHPYWTLGSLLPDMSGTRAARGLSKYFVDIDNCMDDAAYITGGKVEGVCDDGGQRFDSWDPEDAKPGWAEEDYIREIEAEEFILGDIYGGGYAHSPLKTEIKFETYSGDTFYHGIDKSEGNANDAVILNATFNFDPGWVADYNDAVDRAIYGEEEVKYRITGIDWDVDDEDDLADLPEEAVVVLEDGGDEDDAIDQLSDDYGFLVNGVESIERVYESKKSRESRLKESKLRESLYDDVISFIDDYVFDKCKDSSYVDNYNMSRRIADYVYDKYEEDKIHDPGYLDSLIDDYHENPSKFDIFEDGSDLVDSIEYKGARINHWVDRQNKDDNWYTVNIIKHGWDAVWGVKDVEEGKKLIDERELRMGESKKSGNHRLNEGAGAGYSIIFKGIELENIKVTESDENVGDKNFHFEADIKTGEYDWYAEGYDWNTGTDWCGEQVKISGKVTGAYYYYDYNDYDFDVKDAEHEIAKEKYDLGDLHYSGGWSHTDVPEHFVLDEDVDLSDERSGYKEAFVQYAELDIDADIVNAYIDDIMNGYDDEDFEESKIRESEDIRQSYLKAVHDFLDPKLPQKKREEAAEDADFYLQMLSKDNPILKGKSRLQVACWCKTGKFKESKIREYHSSGKVRDYKPKNDFKKSKKYRDDEGSVGDIVKIVGSECVNSALPRVPKFFGQFRKPKFDFSKRPDFKDYKKKGMEQDFSDFKDALGCKGKIVKTLPEHSYAKESFIIEILDGPSKGKEFEFYPGEFFIIKGKSEDKYRFKNYEESKKSGKRIKESSIKYAIVSDTGYYEGGDYWTGEDFTDEFLDALLLTKEEAEKELPKAQACAEAKFGKDCPVRIVAESTDYFVESKSKIKEYTVKDWYEENPYPAAYDKADPLDRYYAIQVKEVNPDYRKYFHHTADVGDFWAGSAFTFVDEFGDAELYETPKKAEEALKEVNDIMDRLAKHKSFEGRPYEFEIVGGYKNVVLDESKKLSERTHRIEHEGNVIGYAEPGEDEYLFYSNGKSSTKFIGFISAETGNVYLKGHLAKEVYEAFPDYIELKKHDNLKESLDDDDDWEDDREDYEGTVSNDLAEMRYLVDKEKSGMSLDSYELRVLQSLIRDYPDEYEKYLNNDYDDPEDYDEEGTYDEYLMYCRATGGDPYSEEEWRRITGIHESKLKEDALSSKIRQSVLEVNAAKQKVDQDVEVLDKVVNKASQDMMMAAINHGKTSQMTESGTSFVHKSIKVDFPLDFDKEECVKEEDARRLLRKIAAERKLRVNTEYKIEDSYGYTSTWEFNETDDPGFRYVFSCKDGDYSCSLYLNKRRNKVDLKNSKFVRDIDRKEEVLDVLDGDKLTEATRYTHRLVLKPNDPNDVLRVRMSHADTLRYRSKEEADESLEYFTKRFGDKVNAKGAHFEVEEIPQKPRRVASQVEGYENPFEVGDILEGDFGYNMILPVWYEVVKVTSKQVTLKELSSIVVSHDGYGQAGVKKPNIGVYKKDWEGKEREIRALVKKHGGSYFDKYDNPKKKYYVTVNNHILDLWDGENKSFDTYD